MMSLTCVHPASSPMFFEAALFNEESDSHVKAKPFFPSIPLACPKIIQNTASIQQFYPKLCFLSDFLGRTFAKVGRKTLWVIPLKVCRVKKQCSCQSVKSNSKATKVSIATIPSSKFHHRPTICHGLNFRYASSAFGCSIYCCCQTGDWWHFQQPTGPTI